MVAEAEAEAAVVIPPLAQEGAGSVQLQASGLVPDAVPARMAIRH